MDDRSFPEALKNKFLLLQSLYFSFSTLFLYFPIAKTFFFVQNLEWKNTKTLERCEEIYSIVRKRGSVVN